MEHQKEDGFSAPNPLQVTLFPGIACIQNHSILSKILYHRTRCFSNFFTVKLSLFSYSSSQTCVLGVQKNSLIETVLLSTHKMFWLRKWENHHCWRETSLFRINSFHYFTLINLISENSLQGF